MNNPRDLPKKSKQSFKDGDYESVTKLSEELKNSENKRKWFHLLDVIFYGLKQEHSLILRLFTYFEILWFILWGLFWTYVEVTDVITGEESIGVVIFVWFFAMGIFCGPVYLIQFLGVQLGREEPFVSGHIGALLLMIILTVLIIFDLLAILIDLFMIEVLYRIGQGWLVQPSELESYVGWLSGLAIVQLITFLFMLVVFFMWIHRVHRNLPALGARDLRFTPGWAIGWFFVPIMNLIRPYEVVREIYKASDPNADISDGCSWKNAYTSPVIGMWWILWLISSFVGYALLRISSGAETLIEFEIMCLVMLGSDMLSIVVFILLIIVVRSIDTRQKEKSKRVATLDTLPSNPSLL